MRWRGLYLVIFVVFMVTVVVLAKIAIDEKTVKYDVSPVSSTSIKTYP